jgi:hypothetical protein
MKTPLFTAEEQKHNKMTGKQEGSCFSLHHHPNINKRQLHHELPLIFVVADLTFPFGPSS